MLRRALVAFAIFALSFLGRAREPVALWPDGAPGAKGRDDKDVPALTPYLPEPSTASGAAFVVCPGGGYGHLAAHEGEPIARWLNSLGIAAFVLRYRIAPDYAQPAPGLDVARAIRAVRSRSADWKVDPARIGVIGFSAGGHLASTAATAFDAGNPSAPDPIDRVSSRPDAAILVYPVISMRELGHAGSRKNLLGENPSEELIARFSSDERVTNTTPPVFLVHSVDDKVVIYENTLLFAAALRRAGVSHEIHIFEHGGHGYGLGQGDPALSAWPSLCAEWLGRRGFLARP